MHAPTEQSTITHQHQMNMVLPNCSDKDVINPLRVKEISQAQDKDSVLKKLSTTDKYSTQLVEDTQVLCKDGKRVIPKVLQRRSVSWYHHYLQHPGHSHLEETLYAAMYWKGMRNTIQSHVKTAIHVKLINNTSISMGNFLQSLPSRTLFGSFVCGSHWTMHSQR